MFTHQCAHASPACPSCLPPGSLSADIMAMSDDQAALHLARLLEGMPWHRLPAVALLRLTNILCYDIAQVRQWWWWLLWPVWLASEMVKLISRVLSSRPAWVVAAPGAAAGNCICNICTAPALQPRYHHLPGHQPAG